MNLQGRNLSLRMQGADVKLLQDELHELGASISDRDGFFGKATRQAVLEFQRSHGLQTTGIVDEATATAINAEVDSQRPEQEPIETKELFIVRGQIHQTDGGPLGVGEIRAFDADLRSRQELGKGAWDAEGRFEITYKAESFARAEKRSADLTFQIENQAGLPMESFKLFALQDGRRVAVEAPQIVFNAPPVATVEIVIGDGEFRGPSEFERYVTELTPVLQGVPFAELKEEEKIKDVTFLFRETRIDPQHIAFLILAHRLALKTDLPPEVFYCFFRQNLPTRLQAILALHPEVQRSALETGFRTNLIPARLRKELARILARLQELIVEHAFREPEVAGKYSLSALLSTALPAQELQRNLLSQYVQHKGAIQEFWKALRSDPAFSTSGIVDKVQYTLQFGALTGNHLPLVKDLQQDGSIKSLRDLAKLDADAWLQRINKKVDGQPIGFPPEVPGKDDAEKARNYATAMVRV